MVLRSARCLFLRRAQLSVFLLFLSVRLSPCFCVLIVSRVFVWKLVEFFITQPGPFTEAFPLRARTDPFAHTNTWRRPESQNTDVSSFGIRVIGWEFLLPRSHIAAQPLMFVFALSWRCHPVLCVPGNGHEKVEAPPSYTLTLALWLSFPFPLGYLFDSFPTTALVLWKVPYWTKFPFWRRLHCTSNSLVTFPELTTSHPWLFFSAGSTCVWTRHTWYRNQLFVTSARALIGQRKHSCLRPPLPPSPHPPFRMWQSATGHAALRNSDLWLTVNILDYHKIAQLSIWSDLLLISIAQQASVSHHPLHPEPVLTLYGRIKAPEPGMTPDGW